MKTDIPVPELRMANGFAILPKYDIIKANLSKFAISEEE